MVFSMPRKASRAGRFDLTIHAPRAVANDVSTFRSRRESILVVSESGVTTWEAQIGLMARIRSQAFLEPPRSLCTLVLPGYHLGGVGAGDAHDPSTRMGARVAEVEAVQRNASSRGYRRGPLSPVNTLSTNSSRWSPTVISKAGSPAPRAGFPRRRGKRAGFETRPYTISITGFSSTRLTSAM